MCAWLQHRGVPAGLLADADNADVHGHGILRAMPQHGGFEWDACAISALSMTRYNSKYALVLMLVLPAFHREKVE